MKEELTVEELVKSQVSVTERQESTRAVTIDRFRPAVEMCRETYGDLSPFTHVIRGVFSGRVVSDANQLMVRSYQINEAAKGFSGLLKEAKAGSPVIVGGYQQDSDPMVVMSINQLTVLIGDAMKKKSIVDALPKSRPPLEDTLEIPLAEDSAPISDIRL